MYFVTLKIVSSKEQAGQWMADHKVWLQRGFDDGVFLASGNLQGVAGGGIVAHGVDAAALRQRLDEDPLVVHDIVAVDIVELAVSKTDSRMAFLMGANE